MGAERSNEVVIPFLYRLRIIGKDFFLCSLYEARRYNREIYAICLATNGEKGAGKPPMVSRNPSMGKGASPLLNPRAPRSCRPDVVLLRGRYKGKLIAKCLFFCARAKASAFLPSPLRGRWARSARMRWCFGLMSVLSAEKAAVYTFRITTKPISDGRHHLIRHLTVTLSPQGESNTLCSD